MNTTEKIALTKRNIWNAIRDYGLHTTSVDVLDDVTSCFVDRLAEDSVKAKSALREMFRKSPAWDEELDALVINGTRTHNPDYKLIADLASRILRPAYKRLDYKDCDKLTDALGLFQYPNDDPTDHIKALNEIAPKAYAPGKKLSRIFKALCVELGVVDESAGSDFSRLYAQLADELSSKKIAFKLFVSLNPAHFITMSNPVDDLRGETLVSCHSFNRTDYSYNNGCAGYARDDVTMIAFTTSDPNDPETLNNRKTTRQLFMYKPGNGLLLQSRLYNTRGGTHGAQTESKVYRDLIQREISECEDVPNLWRSFKYRGNNKGLDIYAGAGFGGYSDWTYSDFNAVASIRNDHANDYKTFNIGTHGLCISCGSLYSHGLYCNDCKESHSECCADCEESFDEDELYQVHNRHGDLIWVCSDCRDEYYACCEICGEYHHLDNITYTGDDCNVCDNCLDSHYRYCRDCEEYYRVEYMNTAIDSNGYEFEICDSCRDASYVLCDGCGYCVHEDVVNDNGLCPVCAVGEVEEAEAV